MDVREKKIFYATDFEATMPTDERGFSTPFRFLFWSAKRARRMEATYDGRTYTNCRINSNGTLTIIFDHANLGIGDLMLQRMYSTASTNYPDGSYDVVMPAERVMFVDDNGEYAVSLDIYTGESIPVVPVEEEATLSANDIFVDASGGDQIIQLGSSKTGDSFTIVTAPEEDWATITDLGNNQYEVHLQPTTDLNARSTSVTFANTQGIEISVPISQKEAVISQYGAWQLTLGNSSSYTKDYNSAIIALSATAKRTDTYNNGLTKEVTGTPTWSSSDAAWAPIVGSEVRITKCTRISSDTRTATITATIASVGGNEAKTASFTIIQSVMPEIVVSPASFTGISASGATKTATITTYGNVGTLSATSSNTNVATASITGSTISVTVLGHETSSARTATITIKDASANASDVTISISQNKATFMLYYGSSAALPESISTTNGVTLANNATVKIETTNTQKHKCHWVAAKSTATYSIKSWLDKLDTDLNGLSKIKTATVGDYKVYYLLSTGYIANSSRITINV